jgi:hypothetical protein
VGEAGLDEKAGDGAEDGTCFRLEDLERHLAGA